MQSSKESNAALAKKYSLNIKTVAKWTKAARIEDVKSVPIL